MSTPLSVRQFSNAGQVISVPVAQILFSQTDIDYEKVKRMRKKGTSQMPAPVGARRGDKVVVQDGHHRTTADIQNRRKSIDVRVF